MARMIDYGQTCATCRHLGNARYTVQHDGQKVEKAQCLEDRYPTWTLLSDRCDKWAPRAPGESK